jgi:beta-lactamase regulating signal transducer with metallopeptidase domain
MMALGPDVAPLIVERLGWTLLHSIWQWLVIGLAAWLIRTSLRRSTPNARYVAAVLLLGVGSLGSVLTFCVVESERPETWPHFGNQTASAQPAESRPSNAGPNRSRAPAAFSPTGVVNVGDPAADSSRILAVDDEAAQSFVLDWRQKVASRLPMLVAAWLSGVFLLSLRLGAIWLRVRCLLQRNAAPIGGTLREAADQLSSRLHIPAVRLIQTAAVQVPVAVGWIRPIVVFPTGIVLGLSPAQLEALLSHELAHLSRRDYLVNLAQSVIEIVFFYHPVVWWLSRCIRCEREEACDDLAVSVFGNPVLYARALAAVASSQIASSSLAVSASGGSLLNRIERLLLPKVNRQRRSIPTPAWIVGIVATAIGALAAVGTVGPIPHLQKAMAAATGTASETKGSQSPAANQLPPRASGALLGGTTPVGVDAMQIPAFGGTVVDSEGRPAKSADVFLRMSAGANDGSTGEPVFSVAVASVALTGGSFSFPAKAIGNPESRLLYPYVFDVIALRKGSALGWWHILDPRPIEIKLDPEFVLRGFVTSEGKPVEGAVVSVVRVVTKGELAWKAANFGHRVDTSNSGTIELGGLLHATTNARGEFELGGLPKEVGVVLQIEHPGFVRQRAYAVTTNIDKRILQADLESRVHPTRRTVPDWQANRATNEIISGEIESNPMTVELRKGIDLEVRVIDEISGAPIAGAALPQGPGLWGRSVMHVTDSRGVASLENYTAGELFLRVTPPEKSVFLDVSQRFKLLEKDSSHLVTIKLRRGLVLSGSVVDRQTRKGIGGARIIFVRAIQEAKKVLPSAANTIRYGTDSRTAADKDGRFQLSVPGGAGELVLWGPVPGYRTYSQSGSVIDAPSEFHKSVTAVAGRPATDVVFELDRAPAFVAHVVDPNGRAISGVNMRATVSWHEANSVGGWRLPLEAVSDRAGRIRVDNLFGDALRPNQTLRVDVTFGHRRRGLGAQLSLEPPLDGKDVEREVRLEWLGRVTLRLVDRVTKKGVPDVRVAVSRRHSGSLERTLWPNGEALFTDANGMFSFEGVIPRIEHSVVVYDSRRMDLSPSDPDTKRGIVAEPNIPGFVVEPGETRDLGTFELTTK